MEWVSRMWDLYLPFMIKVKYDSYGGTDWNDKM